MYVLVLVQILLDGDWLHVKTNWIAYILNLNVSVICNNYSLIFRKSVTALVKVGWFHLFSATCPRFCSSKFHNDPYTDIRPKNAYSVPKFCSKIKMSKYILPGYFRPVISARQIFELYFKEHSVSAVDKINFTPLMYCYEHSDIHRDTMLCYHWITWVKLLLFNLDRSSSISVKNV